MPYNIQNLSKWGDIYDIRNPCLQLVSIYKLIVRFSNGYFKRINDNSNSCETHISNMSINNLKSKKNKNVPEGLNSNN